MKAAAFWAQVQRQVLAPRHPRKFDQRQKIFVPQAREREGQILRALPGFTRV
jgi:hypothetical protein